MYILREIEQSGNTPIIDYSPSPIIIAKKFLKIPFKKRDRVALDVFCDNEENESPNYIESYFRMEEIVNAFITQHIVALLSKEEKEEFALMTKFFQLEKDRKEIQSLLRFKEMYKRQNKGG